MKVFPAIFIVIAATVTAVSAAERDVVRTFPVRPGCSLSVDTFDGSITVNESDAEQIRVAVHLEIGGDTDADAERLLGSLNLEMTAEGAAVRVRARDARQTGARFVWDENKQIEPTYRITVPAHCDLELRTRTGTIIVGNITGTLRARAETGDVFFRQVGGHIDATTGKGDVVVSRCLGTLNASTALGSIRLGTMMGPCEVRDDSGDVEIMEAKSDIHVRAEAGRVAIDFPRDYAGKAQIETDGGPIVAAVDPAADCDILASTSFLAHVKPALPLQIVSGRAGGRKLVAKLNHGGHRIELHASGGDITLKRGDSPFE